MASAFVVFAINVSRPGVGFALVLAVFSRLETALVSPPALATGACQGAVAQTREVATGIARLNGVAQMAEVGTAAGPIRSA